MSGQPAAKSSARVLRVVQLLSADSVAVTRRAAGLPARISAVIAELPVGTLLTLEWQRAWWDLLPRRIALGRLDRRLSAIAADTERVVVVAAALIVGGAVLVAQRSHPQQLAGQWEFPGGKVELGESPRAGLVRECAEELGCTVITGPELGRQELHDRAILVLYQVVLAQGSAQPQPLEHRELRWARAGDLEQLDWAGTNGQFVADVTARL